MITSEMLANANRSMKTTDVKGKPYVEVNERIKAFRAMCPGGSISTEILSMENGIVTMRTTVCDEEGRVLATGLAQEKESSSYINKTSYVENCETSAVGRALGLCGIGIDGSVASAEEVANAINNQNKTNKPMDARSELIVYLKGAGLDMKEVSKEYKLTKNSTDEDFKRVLNILLDKELGAEDAGR